MRNYELFTLSGVFSPASSHSHSINNNHTKANIVFLLLKNRSIIRLLLFISLSFNIVQAQEELNVIHGWKHYKNATDALYNHLTGQAYDFLEKRNADVGKLHTLEDWQQRQQTIKESLLDIIGPFPEKTPLNARILNTIEKKDYRIEHIIFESQPSFYVTSSLFIPSGLKENEKAASIIYCSGHSPTGYRGYYEHVILNLVKKGFVVFAFDPVGQGERLQYYDSQSGKSVVGPPTREHAYMSAQTFITGISLTRYNIWDGIRAVDYLLTREEVDSAKIGITGRSGGGYQSAYIAPFDERIYASAIENHISNYKRILQSIGPRDGEQNLIHMFSRGIDQPDFLSIRAPKPVLMITTANDMFNIQGSRETAQEVSSVYNVYNKKENFNMVEDIAGHSSTKKNREAMYAFFQKHLNNPGFSFDEEVELLTEEEMRVTSTGQVSTFFNNVETVYSLNKKEAEKLICKLESLRGKTTNYQQNVIESAQKISGYREPEDIPLPILTGCIQREGYIIEKYFIKGEGDYPVPYLLMIPDKPNNKALIYLHPAGKTAEASANEEIEWFVRKGFTVLAPDMIGTGETGPGDWQGGSYFNHANNNGLRHDIWYASMLIGRSIVGIRAADVGRLARILKNITKNEKIYAVAKQEMSPVLLHAAAFDSVISRIALIEPYSSYRSIVMNRYYSPAFIDNAVPEALKYYDLPDLAASLAPRRLLMVNVTDGAGRFVDSEIINDDLSIVRKTYQDRNAERNLIIKSGESLENSYTLFIE